MALDAASLLALWSRLEPAVVEHARFPPSGLDSSLWQVVAAGKVAHPKAAVGARGVGILACSREAAWLAVTDDHPVDVVSGLSQVALRGAWASEKRLYQRLDLPWPFVDRHWVLHSTNNVALAQASGVWERAWENDVGALPAARALTDAAQFDAALPVPVNRGSWLLVALDATHTLGIYTAEADLGGGVPAAAAEAYTASTLDQLYASTLRDALDLRHRYGPGCVQQPGGDGLPIGCFDGG